ncbi:MAG: hypothetical protein HY094_01355 [Candidatus Melainabacteria bacterium]|nr:hypothetical protein [Candidatus Melainabacteria bacterium]
MLITSVGSFCTNKDRYDAALARYPLAAVTFDELLCEPITPPSISDGVFDIPGTKYGSQEVGYRKEAVNGYATEVYDLSPIFHYALAGKEQISKEFILLSGYDLKVDDFYKGIREPKRNAKKIFEPGEIERLNEEEKAKAKRRTGRGAKRIQGYNPDFREFKIKTGVATDAELVSNFYGSAIPTIKLLDKRFVLLLLNSVGLGLNSFSDEERIGALNIVAQLLIDTHGEIQRQIAIDDKFKENIKTLRQVRTVLKDLISDPNKRLSRNARILDDCASALTDDCLRNVTRFKELKELNQNPDSHSVN